VVFGWWYLPAFCHLRRGQIGLVVLLDQLAPLDEKALEIQLIENPRNLS